MVSTAPVVLCCAFLHSQGPDGAGGVHVPTRQGHALHPGGPQQQEQQVGRAPPRFVAWALAAMPVCPLQQSIAQASGPLMRLSVSPQLGPCLCRMLYRDANIFAMLSDTVADTGLAASCRSRVACAEEIGCLIEREGSRVYSGGWHSITHMCPCNTASSPARTTIVPVAKGCSCPAHAVCCTDMQAPSRASLQAWPSCWLSLARRSGLLP